MEPTDQASPVCHFLRLPLEVRREIHRPLLVKYEPITLRDYSNPYVEGTNNIQIDILRASKFISEEALDVLYGASFFLFWISEQDGNGADSIKLFTERNRARVRHSEMRPALDRLKRLSSRKFWDLWNTWILEIIRHIKKHISNERGGIVQWNLEHEEPYTSEIYENHFKTGRSLRKRNGDVLFDWRFAKGELSRVDVNYGVFDMTSSLAGANYGFRGDEFLQQIEEARMNKSEFGIHDPVDRFKRSWLG